MENTINGLFQQHYVSVSDTDDTDDGVNIAPSAEIIRQFIADTDGIEVTGVVPVTPDETALVSGHQVVIDPVRISEIASQFSRIMMLYDSGIREVRTKLDILSNEFKVKRNRSPIESVHCRVKSPASILEKMKKREYPLTIGSMTENISDIAGVRIICPFIEDIYTVSDMLTNQDDIYIMKKKDYIKRPKENGYRSLHLVIEVPIFLSDHKQHVRVEVQIRTMAMDFWASIEHQIHYKQSNVPQDLTEDLRRCAQSISDNDEKMQEIARRLGTI